MRVHFMGIGGSGMSAVAQIADAQGHEISGCDLQQNTPYLEKLRAQNPKLKIDSGHSEKHLENVDILAVTPAVFYQNAKHPELAEGQKKNMVMTWQEFMGTYLHKDKYLICIAGTHGKSTTTAMTGLVLAATKTNPTVEVGATVPAWHNNVLVGTGKYFVSEADEYYHNFLHYRPDVIILNNIEMDHPEYFGDFSKLLTAFVDFVKNIKPGGTLIYNADHAGVHQLVSQVKDLNLQLIPYTLADFPPELKLGIAGEHNKANALGVLKLAELLKLDRKVVYQTLSEFSGIGRRVELLGESHGVKVYDDYANHPTAFAASISAVKELNPNAKTWAIIEPHTYSRLKAVLDQLPSSLHQADEVVITKIFASREQDPGDFTEQDIAKAVHHPHVQVLKEFDQVVGMLKDQTKPTDVVLIMGSGESYKLARQILANI